MYTSILATHDRRRVESGLNLQPRIAKARIAELGELHERVLEYPG
jgi:hypothetical protein